MCTKSWWIWPWDQAYAFWEGVRWVEGGGGGGRNNGGWERRSWDVCTDDRKVRMGFVGYFSF